MTTSSRRETGPPEEAKLDRSPLFWAGWLFFTSPLMALKIPALGIGVQNATLAVGGLALVVVLRAELPALWGRLRGLFVAMTCTFAWVGLSAALGSFPALSLRAWLKTGEYGLAFLGLALLCNRETRITPALRIAHVFLLTVALGGVLEALAPHHPLFLVLRSDSSLSIFPRIASVMLWPNQYGIVMILGLILGEILRRRGVLSPILYAATQLLFLTQLAQSGSRNAWLTAIGTIAVGAVLGQIKWRRGLALLAVGALVLVLLPVSAYQLGLGDTAGIPVAHGLLDEEYRRSTSLAPVQQSAALRLELWRVALDVVRHVPVTGMGLGAFPESGGVYVMQRPGFNTHNLALELAAETGLVGLGLAAWSLVTLLRARNRRRRLELLALVALLGGQVLDCFLYDPTFMVLFAFVAALVVSSEEGSE